MGLHEGRKKNAAEKSEGDVAQEAKAAPICESEMTSYFVTDKENIEHSECLDAKSEKMENCECVPCSTTKADETTFPATTDTVATSETMIDNVGTETVTG